MVVERDWMTGWSEHDSAGDEVLRWRAGKSSARGVRSATVT
jgi:hypothetical protein